MTSKKLGLIVIISLVVFVSCSCHAKQKEALSAIINQTIQSEVNYTPSSYQDYEAALAHASAIIEKPFPTGRELSEAEEALQAAIDKLQSKADKGALAALLNQAKTIDEEQYTSASYRRVDAAVSYASSVMNDEDASQWDVDYAEKNIKDRLDALVVATKGIYIKLFL